MTDLERHPQERLVEAPFSDSRMDEVDRSLNDGHNCSMTLGSLVPAASRERPLSDILRERTGAVHTEAERTGIIADIVRSKADRNGYALLLRNILPAYECLEAKLSERSDHPVLGIFARSTLFRSDRLRSDLACIEGSGWERSLPLLESGTAYADCIEQAAAGDGLRLVSHAYVRYFGDLSGGQVLRKLLGKSLSLPAEALKYYEFPELDVQTLKAEMRDALDHAGRIAHDPEILVAEAIAAFEHNIGVSREVQDNASPKTASV